MHTEYVLQEGEAKQRTYTSFEKGQNTKDLLREEEGYPKEHFHKFGIGTCIGGGGRLQRGFHSF